MNGRAIGCIALGAIVFVLIGIAGINVASSRIRCPNRLQWGDRFYAPTGTPAPSPDTGGASPDWSAVRTAARALATALALPARAGDATPARASP